MFPRKWVFPEFANYISLVLLRSHAQTKQKVLKSSTWTLGANYSVYAKNACKIFIKRQTFDLVLFATEVSQRTLHAFIQYAFVKVFFKLRKKNCFYIKIKIRFSSTPFHYGSECVLLYTVILCCPLKIRTVFAVTTHNTLTNWNVQLPYLFSGGAVNVLQNHCLMARCVCRVDLKYLNDFARHFAAKLV